MCAMQLSATGNGDTSWKAQKRASALRFRAAFEKAVRINETDFAASGLFAHQEIEVSFASDRGSFHWFTVRLTWAVLVALLRADVPVSFKDSIMMVPGPLADGTT